MTAADRLLTGRAFEDYLETVKLAARTVDRFGAEVDDLDRAEWYRFVTRLMRNGFERFVENCEPERPRLRDAPWRQAINFQSPDQDHLLAEFVDGRHDYVIRGNRGTIPYFVMASWTAPQPTHPGDQDWAPQGVGGLKTFDPATLTTTGFLQSDSIPFDADGNFEVFVGRERAADGRPWLPITDGCVGLLVRTVYHLREETIAPRMTIRRADGAAPRPIAPADMADALAKSGQVVLGYAELVRRWWQDNLGKRPNRIRFSRAVYLSNGGVPDRHHGFGTWECGRDEALVLRFTPTPCDYWIFQLCNIWQENLDNYEDGGGHIQKYRAVYEPDGSVLIVVASGDAGIGGNSIDPYGHAHGGMSLRLIKTQGEPPPVSLWRVPLARLRAEGRALLDATPPIQSGEITD
ncbi:MAG: hypothetical protein KAY22_09500 [Rhizorhabdus sp.]|uniref:hypothetical protein n=1 Tax=Rhizorhabdus sp. TaxID=1968843 RepID=UPI001B5F6668|nr:hypothetical protein [Rhizorhabdus sp.]MBP8232529.1 hypothetical protein [Rhizorhabdus sp.]